MHRTYDVGGEIFGLRASSAAVGEWLDATFSRYVVDRPPPQNFYHYSVHTPDTAGPGLGRRFATLYVGSGVSVRTFSLRVLAEAIINEFSVWPSVRSADGAFLDAGVARVGGLTVLVQGRLIKWMGEHQIRARRSGVTLSAEVAVSLDAATKTVGRLPRLDLPDDAVESLVSLLGAAGLEDGAIDRFTLDTPVAIDAVCDADWLDEGLLRDTSAAEMVREYAVGALNIEASGGKLIIPMGELFASIPCYTISSRSPQEVFDALVRVADQQVGRGPA